MRLMILHLLFEGFDGRACGHQRLRRQRAPRTGSPAGSATPTNGVDVLAREGEPARSNRYVLDRASWDARPAELRPDVTLVGVEAARQQLGI